MVNCQRSKLVEKRDIQREKSKTQVRDTSKTPVRGTSKTPVRVQKKPSEEIHPYK